MKKYIILFLAAFCWQNVAACEACSKQQPKFLQGITHGSGPDSNWDYLIVGIMVIVTLYILIATIRCFLRPADKNEQHIKSMIFNNTDQ